MGRLGRGIFCAGAVFAASAAWPANCGFEYCWGAVGVGPEGEWGWSSGYAVENGAIAKVQNACPDCTTIETFYNTCGAMALGSDGAYGFGRADTRGAAERSAISFCADFGAECRPVVWSCSY